MYPNPFINKPKKLIKTLISAVLWLLINLLSLKALEDKNTMFLKKTAKSRIRKVVRIRNTVAATLFIRVRGTYCKKCFLRQCSFCDKFIYVLDEPSAYLDSEQRLVAAKVIKRFILHAKKTGFVVEHDFIMATYLADRVREHFQCFRNRIFCDNRLRNS